VYISVVSAHSDPTSKEDGNSQTKGLENRAVEDFHVILAAEQREHENVDVAANRVTRRKSIVTIKLTFIFCEFLLQLEVWSWLFGNPLMGRPKQSAKVVETYHREGMSRPKKPYRQ